MDSLSSFARSLTRHLISVAVVALPLAILAFAGCSGDVQQETTGDGSTCTRSTACASGAVCVLPPNACGADAKGSCQSLFQCDGPPSGPVCGCDGKVVEGEYPDCEPAFATSSYQDPAACQTGTFACGPTLTCKRNSDVCVARVPGDTGPTTYECAAFETVRGWCQHTIPDCNCLDATKLGAPMTTMCAADADHQETITVSAP